MSMLDRHKDDFAILIGRQIIALSEADLSHEERQRANAKVCLLVLDAIEFGIQLGGMEWKEGE